MALSAGKLDVDVEQGGRALFETDFAQQLQGKRLTTAEVLYYMPDHPKLIQSFMWQTLDVAPEFPRVHRFLQFWMREIDAVIHSVSLSAAGLVTPPKVRFTKELVTIN
jgi:uncharacterized protein Usg